MNCHNVSLGAVACSRYNSPISDYRDRTLSSQFDPAALGAFCFDDYQFDPGTGVLQLRYHYHLGPAFCERLVFPGAPWTLTQNQQQALDGLFQLLHWIAGVSYYKAACPAEIRIAAPSTDQRVGISPSLSDFLNQLYLHGLGEFAYVNELALQERIAFPSDGVPRVAIALNLPRRTLVPLGGGKDSLVCLEMLRSIGEEPVLFSLGSAPLISQVAEETGLEHIRVSRELAPELFELNRAGAYNGHVPVTAIVSLVALCVAVVEGFDRVAMSNERSADVGNLTLDSGIEVNHQYSKSFAFESALRGILAEEIVSGLDYFSLLRPLSEAAVTARFSSLTQYHAVFSSCNRNFHLSGERPPRPWCGDCPKCRFVFLALAPFLSPESMTAIFGEDLLQRSEQLPGFRALLGLGDHKPFECVGEVDESRALMAALGKAGAWRGHVIVAELAPLCRDSASLDDLLVPSGKHCIPADLQRLIQPSHVSE